MNVWRAAGTIVLAACGLGFTSAKGPPPFEKIKQTVEQYFQGRGYQLGVDVITREEVAPLLKQIEALGWKVPDPNVLLAKVHESQDFVVQQLRTPAGRKFARQAGKYRLSYDRLDRLAALPHGRSTVQDLIRGPDGYKMVEYLTSVSGGKEMGRMLSKAPQGADFNSPTGYIYTASMLVEHLQRLYDAETTAKKK